MLKLKYPSFTFTIVSRIKIKLCRIDVKSNGEKVTNENELTELEYKVLSYLREDSRMSASKIAKELGVSRTSVAKAIQSLREKGVKFTVEYYEKDKLTVFSISENCPNGFACYKLIDGKYLVIMEARMEQMVDLLSKLKSSSYYVSVGKEGFTKVKRSKLVCDYCGGEIKGEPILLKRGKKIYYTCCKACSSEMEKKLNVVS